MLKNYSIKMKLIIGIIITVLILSATGVTIYILNEDVDHVTDELKDEYLLRIEISSHLKEAASDFRRSLELYNVTGNPAYLSTADQDLVTFESEIGELQALAEAHTELTDLLDTISEVRADVAKLRNLKSESVNATKVLESERAYVDELANEVSALLIDSIHALNTALDQQLGATPDTEEVAEEEAVEEELVEDEKLILDLEAVRNLVDLLEMMEDVNYSVSDSLIHLYQAQLSKDYSQVTIYTDKITQAKDQVDLLKTDQEVFDQETIDKIQFDLEELVVKMNDIVVDENHLLDLNQELNRVSSHLLEMATEINESGIADGIAGAEKISDEVGIVSTTLVTGFVAAILISILVNMYISHSITKPLKVVVDVNESMGRLDFTPDLAEIDKLMSRKDELGLISTSTHEVLVNVKQLITELKDGLLELSSSAEESMAISENIDSSSDNQRVVMEEVSQAVDDLSRSINDTAENVSELAELISESNLKGEAIIEKSKETIDLSHEGKNKMHAVTSAMNTIVESMDTLAGSIDKLGLSANEIRSIIAIINGISEQTNLLALNAAIEAARAGEAGRGFAVVADEIRKLAEVSTQSTNKISDLVNNMEDVISETIKISNDSKDRVDNSSQFIGQTNQAFDQIFDSVESNNKVSQEIIDMLGRMNDKGQNVASTAEEQAASSEEIASSVASVSQLAGDISTGSKDMSSAAENVTQVCVVVDELVNKFDV